MIYKYSLGIVKKKISRLNIVIITTVLAVTGFIGIFSTVNASSQNVQLPFTDNFNDNNYDGWTVYQGNWWVENGALREQTDGGINSIFVDKEYSSQTIETDFKVSCFGCMVGFNIWWQSWRDHIEIITAANYGSIFVNVVSDGVGTQLTYPITPIPVGYWDKMKAIANASDGTIAIYLNDTFVHTFTVDTPTRTGVSGVTNNSSYVDGVFYDNFSIVPPLTDKIQCMHKIWEVYGFSNQGKCVSSIETSQPSY